MTAPDHVVSTGADLFADALDAQAVDVDRVEWRPPMPGTETDLATYQRQIITTIFAAGLTTTKMIPHKEGKSHAEGLDGMLRTRGVVLVVDGYNVSMAGWPGTPVDRQRDQLVGALERLHLRLRCDVVVVFDGADVIGVSPRRTRGVRVVFSPAGEPADPVIIREVAALPLKVPVVVAWTSAWLGSPPRFMPVG